MKNDEHKVSLEELFQRLGSRPSGLTTSEASERQLLCGPNSLEIKKRVSLPRKFARHLVNFFAVLLWLGAGLSFISERLSPGEGSLYIGMALAGVVILNAVFTFIQEYHSEKIIESFRRMMPETIDVLRDGSRQRLQTREVVPGDVIYLTEGDKIPADSRLIRENSLKVDHSSLTGESEPQLRKLECTHDNILESRNMVFSGTSVQSGNGIALVYSTGMDTQIGRIADLTKQTEDVVSPLRRELNHFIRIISAIAIILGLSFFAVSILAGDPFTVSMIFAIGIIVANVPEGLLPTVTLSLSMASKKMAGKMALIKKLESVETLGSTTVICTDKTGTITENRLSVNTLFLNLDERNVHERGIERLSGIGILFRIVVLCNNAEQDVHGNYRGDPTEIVLLQYAGRLGDIQRTVRDNRRLREMPFDSIKKRMITVNEAAGGSTAYLKGAPEVVLSKCGRLIDNGKSRALEEKDKKMILYHYERMASRGERVLGFAYNGEFSGREEDFVFVALIGMIDPPRKEIPSAVAKCRTAGIKVIMITGDYGVTAEAIAGMAGMIDPANPHTITGDTLDSLDDAGLREAIKRENLIFARTSPMQKLRIVKALQAMGEVVTVTGDGVNDAPALKHADMGVAMGVSGTEVAKEAADMVLMDDNFATIVNAIEEGRTVFSNIKKFIGYILTSNIPEILPFIAFVLFAIPLPLTVVLILSIDLGTDILPALGLGIETPEDDVMIRPPRPRTERLLSPKLLLKSYGIYGMVQGAAGFFSYFAVLLSGGWRWGESLPPTDPLYLRAVTAFFVSIVICQISNVMICRTNRESVFKKGLFSNRLILLGITFELFLVWLIIGNATAQNIFGTSDLTIREIALSLPFALFILLADETRKLLLRRKNSFVSRSMDW
jgi:sodium/potassium-transporting ATPase subunit alpha